MARSNDIMERSNEIMEGSNEIMKGFAGREDGLRVFIRDQNTRTERVIDRLLSGFETRMEDMGDQIRANTAATWALLDRFNGPSGT